MKDQKQHLLRTTFRALRPISQVFALTFYQRLFELDPQARFLFKTDIEEQGRKLMQALTMLVDSLDCPEDVRPALEALGRRHVTYGVREEQYDTVGAALLWSLQTVLGEGLVPEARAAWAELYGTVAETMKRAARTNPGRPWPAVQRPSAPEGTVVS